MMVYTTGRSVHGFTLDQGLGEFVLSHPDIRIPNEAPYYSVNHGGEKYWTEGVRKFTRHLQGLGDETRAPLKHRYIGSLVADVHRNLLKGGIFYYPGTLQDRDKPYGKIRLMYEAQAMAYIISQAGGYSSDGIGDILNIRPHTLHQRCPVFMGSRDLVKQAEAFIQEYDAEWISLYRGYRNRENVN